MKPRFWPKRTPTAQRQRGDAEFLPAALEILETPASPVKTALIWLMAALVAAALAWSLIGSFDIVATAQGKIQPLGRVKVIQSLETARVRAIPVTNGQHVEAGELIVDLDDSELAAERETLAIGLQALKAELARRGAALEAVAEIDAIERLVIVFPDDVPVAIRAREQAVLDADLAELTAGLDRLDARAEEKRAEAQRLAAMIAAQRRLVATLAERVAMRDALVRTQAASRADLINASEVAERAETELAEQVGQLAEAETGLQVLAREKTAALRSFAAEHARHRAEVARRAEEQEQQLIKASARLEALTIRSPVPGIVQASAVTTAGQVVLAGAELMRIVPDGTPVEVEAYLPNKDIGFVAKDLPAVIKVEAFPFTRYGVIDGEVSHVATDAIPEPDAAQIEQAAAKAIDSLVPTGNVQRVQNLVFPVTIRPRQAAINVDGKDVALKPGMAVTVEIKTGKRRILDYLLSPIAKVTSEAMGER